MQKILNYIELVKPRLTAMALFSGAIGYLAALSPTVDIPWLTLFHLVTALAFVGAASNIMNQAMEHKLDAMMDRTVDRPIPSGRVHKENAQILSIICLIIGLLYLQIKFDSLITFLGFLTFLSYVVIYTPMKTRSSLNTVVGALPGALPILTGWVACREQPDFQGFVVFSIIFVWQLPHFFSIAWIYKEDYKRAGYKMMSLYDDTGKQAVVLIIVGTLGLIAVSFLPFLVRHTGDLYLIGSFPANALLLTTSLLLIKDRNKYMKLYFYGSITWLPYMLTLMVFDRI
jgi:heme o synthase